MINNFIFEKYVFDSQTGELLLTYLADDEYTFTEKIIFPNAPFDVPANVLNKVCAWIHIACGISYYKAVLPQNIQIRSCTLDVAEASFFKVFYEMGLGQFAFENKINLNGKVNFPHKKKEIPLPFDIKLDESSFVPVGGGKDSCVTIELLKAQGLTPTLISVNTARPIQACKARSGLKELTIKRILSDTLLKNSKLFFNGHVPITGVLAFILLMACVLYKKSEIVMSCESSADEANIGLVNHQWSKSRAFERYFRQLIVPYFPSLRYYSLLRSYREIDIARMFADLCQNYFDIFTSCNHAFHIDTQKRLERWCGQCDKCRFVFLILAPFMDRKKLIEIVGKNPLNDMNQLDGYRQLLGLEGIKPFECVGTIEESREAFKLICKNPLWKNDYIVQVLKNEIK